MGRRTTKITIDKNKIYGKAGNGWTHQSLAYVDKDHRLALCSYPTGTGTNSGVSIIWYSHNTRKKTYSNVMHAGHVNGGTYCHKNKRIYVVHGKDGSAYSEIYGYDISKGYSNPKLVYKTHLPVGLKGLGYDRVTGQFYGHAGVVGGSAHVYVFPYEAFANFNGKKYNGNYKSYKNFTLGSGYFFQDCAGYNGVIMSVRSKQVGWGSAPAYIDCFDAHNGKYLGSYSFNAEVESVAVEETTHKLHVLTSGGYGRYIFLANQTFKYGGSPANIKGYSASGTPVGQVKTVSETALRNKIVKKAKSYTGQGGKHFWDTYGMSADNWCGAFVWTIFKECGMSNIVTKTAYVPTWHEWLDKNATKRSTKTAKPGDIIIYNGNSHVEIVGSVSNGVVKSIGGNTGASQGSPYYKYSTVSAVRKHTGSITGIWSPKYSKVKGVTGIDEDSADLEQAQATFEVHPEQLVSSQNYAYIMTNDADSEEKAKSERAALFSSLTRNMNNSTILDTTANMEILEVSSAPLTDSKRPQTKVEEEVTGAQFPVALNPVEAPFAELTLGGYTFGLHSADGYPNYIQGLNVVRTNGSMNEYTINLIHQVSPGSNPNFIDELIAKNSYDKLTLQYGDANSDVVFIDSSALLTGANVKFDFASSLISYTLMATSSVVSTATHKKNYPARTDKPSNVIRDLLKDNQTGLADAFPKMRDATFIAQNNLIPTNDSVITLEAVSDISPLNYLKQAVAAMTSETSKTSNYYLVLEDEYFKIYEIDSNNAAYDASVYEVTLNYPDDNQVFSFSSDTDFSWPIAYEYSGDVTEYDYNMESNSIVSYHSPQILDFTSSQKRAVNDNWWKQVTEFPTKATLECRGLLSPMLLMTYVKVNALFYGQQRLTSGVYIITGQEDTLTGSGYRTKLSLLRVAGPQQHLTVDGRVKT